MGRAMQENIFGGGGVEWNCAGNASIRSPQAKHHDRCEAKGAGPLLAKPAPAHLVEARWELQPTSGVPKIRTRGD